MRTLPYTPADLPEALALADASPLSVPHVADWPYRFASWAFDALDIARVWRDDAGRMLGWCALQTPFWAIDCVAHPDAPPGLYGEMMVWAQQRARALAADGGGRPMWFISIDAACAAQRAVLESNGLVDVFADGDDAWSKVLFELDAARSMPSPQLPDGMTIRSLDPNNEIEAYVALHRAVFGSENMTAPWRARVTRMDGYRNALDLVLVDASGSLAGFCVAWLRQRATGEWAGQIEPLGLREDVRGRKLSRQLMAEAVRRLRAHGAARIFVETDRQRDAALAAYHAMGFVEAHDVRVYRYSLT